MNRLARDVAKGLLIAAAYVALAKVGLRFASMTRSVTLVWPPSGLSLAVLVLLGRRYWPGIALGALVANASTPGVSPFVAAGIAAGNTLEALAGAYLLRRTGFVSSLRRVADVLQLAILGALVSTAVSATLGVASLRLGSLIQTADLPSTWRVWWLGDLMGDLVFAPLLLTLAAAPRPTITGPRTAELALLIALLIVVTLLGFHLLPLANAIHFPEPYVVFPLLSWAALRFGPRGAAGANLLVSAISVAATVNGSGPFARETLNESLFQLQTFMALTVLTSLLLGAAMAERDRAIALRDDFLSLASHELNNPIAALQFDVGSLSRMLNRGGAPAEKIQHRMAHTERQLDRLKNLVSRMLDSSQIAAGRLALARATIDLAEVAREVAQGFGPEVADRGGNIEVLAPTAVEGQWDRIRLELVVGNLLSNAVRYGSDGPIKVTVNGTEAEATVRVADAGIGIARDQQERIFERFERAVPTGSYPGFGLGLWIARASIEEMGGRIRVESELGAGSTFTVTLPRNGHPSRAHRDGTGPGDPLR